MTSAVLSFSPIWKAGKRAKSRRTPMPHCSFHGWRCSGRSSSAGGWRRFQPPKRWPISSRGRAAARSEPGFRGKARSSPRASFWKCNGRKCSESSPRARFPCPRGGAVSGWSRARSNSGRDGSTACMTASFTLHRKTELGPSGGWRRNGPESDLLWRCPVSRLFRWRRESNGEAAGGFSVQFPNQFIAALAQIKARQRPLGGKTLQQKKIVRANHVQQAILALALRFRLLAPRSGQKGRFIRQAVQAWPILAFIAILSTGTRGHGEFDD